MAPVEKFEVLTPRQHVIARPNMYIGSVTEELVSRFVMGQWKEARYVPGLDKMISEIIDNSIDEAIRSQFSCNQISVNIHNDVIEVIDNGRGIPFNEITLPNKKKVLQPEAAWTQVNAGTSFNNDRVTIGANGLGSACTNFMSVRFEGKTWHNNQLFEMVSLDGAERIISKLKDTALTTSGTSVRFIPNFSLFGINSLDENDSKELVIDRLMSLSVAFPEIRFKYNKKLIKENTIKKYAQLYSNDSIVVEKDRLGYFIFPSTDGFRSTSFINGVNTRNGGSYVDFIVNSIVSELATLITKKHKITITKSAIKNGLGFVLFARGFKNPKYDSQTKERLTSNISDIKDHFLNSGYLLTEFNRVAKKILATSAIIDPIIETALAKRLMEEKRAATAAQKKLKRVRVEKHIAATNMKMARLFIVEGDSALSQLQKVRNPKTIGGYPLRGVIMNVWDMKTHDILKNKELSELIAVLGLDMMNPNSYLNMNYNDIAILTDADNDGIGHIAPLLLAFFYKFWPGLFEDKRISITRTPILISSGKADIWSYSFEDAAKTKEKYPNYHHRYIKGLASHTEKEYEKIINNPVLDHIEIDNPSLFEMIYGNDVNLRKEWLLK